MQLPPATRRVLDPVRCDLPFLVEGLGDPVRRIPRSMRWWRDQRDKLARSLLWVAEAQILVLVFM